MDNPTETLSYDVDANSFDQMVVDRSRDVPVLVDFWAEWCGPCRVLKPLLERLAREYGGRFVLAKVDSDRNPELSRRFGVRGIPNVKAFRNGQMVDEFTGALGESAVRAFLDRLMPSPAEALWQSARHAAGEGDRALARSLLDDALAADPGFEPALFDSIELRIDDREIDEASAMIARVQHLANDVGRRDALLARIALASAATGDKAALRAQLDTSPDDLALRFDLANCEARDGDYRAALDHLLAIVRRNARWNDDAARKRMVDLFAMLGGSPSNDALVREYRVQLARALN